MHRTDNYSKHITFFRHQVYTNEDGTLCTTIYGKPSDRRDFLHCKLAHPKALKDSISFRQALRIKRICSKP